MLLAYEQLTMEGNLVARRGGGTFVSPGLPRRPPDTRAPGARITTVPVDREGLVVSALPEHGPRIRLVYVTPSHQFPTGAVLPAARR